MDYICNDAKTIQNAFDRNEKFLYYTREPIPHALEDINMSAIYTKMIQYVGRYAERFASDLLIDIDTINKTIETLKDIKEPERKIFCLGIRRDGVDGNGFLMARIKQSAHDNIYKYIHITHEYRSVLALEIKVIPHNCNPECVQNDNGRAEFTLKDITDNFARIEKNFANC